jgi:putative ABC transport system ATP-binding protein
VSLFNISGLTKEYGEGDAKVVALKNISLDIPKGKLIAILGASGSGKSTMLNMLGCMDKPTSGTIQFNGVDITAFSKRQMNTFRSDHIGFVFQSYNLLPDLTALENVEFSTELAKLPRSDAENALHMVGLTDRMTHYPAELSGGEQQRVSIARAIAKSPAVVLCDEPTGALDFNTGVLVLEVLKQIHLDKKNSILLITHNQEIAKIADMVITMRSGKIFGVSENDTPLPPSEVTW